MKIAATSSKWGNVYRFRYYIDGKRVTLDAYQAALDDWRKRHPNAHPKHSDRLSGMGPDFRSVWED
jgi:hypothetical protein